MKRRQCGDTITHHGQKIRALFVGPDLLAVVDDVELANFYLTIEAAHVADRTYVDQQRAAFKKKFDNA